ncbi:hypothetical protein LPB248_15480 [Flavobacterium sp. LPB0248]|uniref:DUF6624 domain-containing protein n=1 Tax=Flavobacterium sp. LPB0248 TaxID=2614441 RepID=UPI0015A57184|nr:DUF6624 domain-containing protein [Flavobacterium sp. LPB0248]QLC67656.1 hypothetical protein LPB248_15480 [Flavobacterium sp. LPB0248]
MDNKIISERIIELKNADLKLRNKLIENKKLFEGYDEEMEKLHKQNAIILNEIINTIGYPTIDKVGKEASEAAWLIIQHSIGSPDFMKRCAKQLQNAVKENQADPINLAYLKDRIAVLEGNPQLYGTQFDWDEKGNLSPNLFDDLQMVNQRRQSIGLNSLEEQTEIIRNRILQENQLPPEDFEKRKQEALEWRRKTGWIK